MWARIAGGSLSRDDHSLKIKNAEDAFVAALPRPSYPNVVPTGR
jgi:hypothetical protein